MGLSHFPSKKISSQLNIYVWAKFQSVYFPALPRESPENSIKTRGQLGQQKCSRLAAVQHFVANTENSPLHQREKNEIHEARCTAWTAPFSHGQGCLVSLPGASSYGVGCTFWGQAKWHILSPEQRGSAAQQPVPLAGASMSKVLKLVIFSAVPSAVQACSSPTPILIKFIGSNYELG